MGTRSDKAKDGNGGAKPLVFVSYSKKDKTWKDDHLLPQLRALENAGRLAVWSDDDIDAGDKWYPEIAEAMSQASVAVCLISAYYLATGFCVKEEVPYLLKRSEEEGLGLVFVLLSPCPWDDFPWISERQMLPRKGLSVAEDYQGREAGVFLTVANRVKEFLNDPEFQPIRHDVSPELLEVLRELEAPVELAVPAWSALPEDLISIDRLPVTGAELFGRKDELAFLDQAWASGTTNVVSLVAWGGVGKSTLVNKWLEGLRADNYRGAERVFAWSFYSQGTGERVTSADQFVDEALRFFGEADPTRLRSPWAKGERLAELVSREKALLVLDGMEPLQDSWQGIKDPALLRLVEELASNNPGLCLITTRERVRELEDFPDTTSERNLEQISPEAGRALLRVKGVRGTDAELEPTSRAFGNHALAINLLANWLRGIEGHHVSHAAEIPELDIPEEKGRHPRRVMAAFAARFGDGPDVELLRLLGLFDRPADAGAIEALRRPPAIPGLTVHLHLKALGEADWLRLLQRLRDLGLVAPESHHGEGTIDAHPLVREHFAEERRDKLEDAWRAGHLRLYEHFAALPEKHLPDTLEEMAPLFQAVFHGCQAGQYQTAFHDGYYSRIQRDRSTNYCMSMLGAVGSDTATLSGFFGGGFGRPSARLDQTDQAFVVNAMAYRLQTLGRLEEAVAPMEAGLGRRIALEDWQNASIAASNLSGLQVVIGRIADAIRTGEQAVDFANRSGAMQFRTVSQTALGDARHQAGALADAARCFGEAEAVQAVHQPHYPLLYSFRGFRYCDLLLGRGEHGAVRERATQSLEWAQQGGQGSLLDTALNHLSLGRAELAAVEAEDRGDLDVAAEHLDAAVDGLRAAGTQDHLPRGLIAHAALFRVTEEFGRARRGLDAALRITTRRGGAMPLFECDARLEYARLHLALAEKGDREEQLAQARRHLERAGEIIATTGYHRRDGELAALRERLAAAR